MTKAEIKELLEEKYLEYCQPDFIELDPIFIPHQFETKQDIEISGFIAATIAWGQRPTIIKNTNSAMHRMGNEPFRFVMEHSKNNLEALDGFVHRTFNAVDLKQLVIVLKNLYTQHDSLKDVFLKHLNSSDTNLVKSMALFKKEFLEFPHEKRTQKHVSDPAKGSAAKRINM